MREIESYIAEKKLIAILRGFSPQEAVRAAEALCAGGVGLIEVTFVQHSPTCLEDTVSALRAIQEAGVPIRYGAGTVMSPEQVDAAAEAGAEFIISPNVDEAVIRRTVGQGMISIPGAMTPSEIASAYGYGASFVKVFPAKNLGTDYIRAIRASISHIPLLAVGGVDLTNMRDFYKAGVSGFGCGGNLADKKLIRAGKYGELQAVARRFSDEIARLDSEV